MTCAMIAPNLPEAAARKEGRQRKLRRSTGGSRGTLRTRDAVRRGPVPRREDLGGDDEGRRVRAIVLEEVRQAVEEDEGPDCILLELVVAEAHAAQSDRETNEARELAVVGRQEEGQRAGSEGERAACEGGRTEACGPIRR